MGLTRQVAITIANSVDLGTGALNTMTGMAVCVWLFEGLVLAALWATTSDKKVKKGKSFVCPAILLGSLQVIQLIFVFVYIAGYSATDKNYQQILASSSQLADLNGCGDSYMTLDPNVVFKNLQTSQSQLQAGLVFSLIVLIALAI